MFILPLVVTLSVFFLILWLADVFFTIKSTQKKGWELEANPIMRFMLKLRRSYLIIFKIIEIGCFFALTYLISFQDADYAVTSLLIAIGVYSIVVSNGMNIYLKVTRDALPVVIVFFLICLSVLYLAHLNYTTFSSDVMLFQTCSECCTNYAVLKADCGQSSINATPLNQSQNSGLDIKVPG